MPFITSGPSLRRLPLFFVYCPDYPGVLARRLEVRARHWERAKKDTDEGLLEFGLGYMPPPSSPVSQANSQVDLPPGVSPMDGSVLLLRAQNLDAAWKRIKDDIYWTAGVWDKEKAVIREFIKHELYSD